jgi:hypothetical protein
MRDSKRAELLEEAFGIIEQEILLSNEELRHQLRLVRRQIVVVRKFKESGCQDKVGFSDFVQQSIFLIVKTVAILFGNQPS